MALTPCQAFGYSEGQSFTISTSRLSNLDIGDTVYLKEDDGSYLPIFVTDMDDDDAERYEINLDCVVPDGNGTPASRIHFKPGDLILVNHDQNDTGFEEGSAVIFSYDDDSFCPRFRTPTDSNTCYINLGDTEFLPVEKYMPVRVAFPNPYGIPVDTYGYVTGRGERNMWMVLINGTEFPFHYIHIRSVGLPVPESLIKSPNQSKQVQGEYHINGRIEQVTVIGEYQDETVIAYTDRWNDKQVLFAKKSLLETK